MQPRSPSLCRKQPLDAAQRLTLASKVAALVADLQDADVRVADAVCRVPD